MQTGRACPCLTPLRTPRLEQRRRELQPGSAPRPQSRLAGRDGSGVADGTLSLNQTQGDSRFNLLEPGVALIPLPYSTSRLKAGSMTFRAPITRPLGLLIRDSYPIRPTM